MLIVSQWIEAKRHTNYNSNDLNFLIISDLIYIKQIDNDWMFLTHKTECF